MLFVVDSLSYVVLPSQTFLCVGAHSVPARRFGELRVSRPDTAVHVRFLHSASVRHARASEDSVVGYPAGKNFPRKAIDGHPHDVADPSEQPGLVVSPELSDAEFNQEGGHIDASSSGVAEVHAAHCTNTVVVESSKFTELCLP